MDSNKALRHWRWFSLLTGEGVLPAGKKLEESDERVV
jgi:hypothetical protein